MSSLECFLGHKRAEAIAEQVIPHIGNKAIVADIGAGDCWVSKELSRHMGSIIPIDILDTNVTDLDLNIYDGTTLPLENNAVDTSLLVFVLHHAINQSRVLAETKRVTKPDGQIIVIEDTPQGLVQHSLWRVVHERQHKRNPELLEAHGIRTAIEWKEFFDQNHSNTLEVHTFRNGWISNGFYQHSLFVLDNMISNDQI